MHEFWAFWFECVSKQKLFIFRKSWTSATIKSRGWSISITQFFNAEWTNSGLHRGKLFLFDSIYQRFGSSRKMAWVSHHNTFYIISIALLGIVGHCWSVGKIPNWQKVEYLLHSSHDLLHWLCDRNPFILLHLDKRSWICTPNAFQLLCHWKHLLCRNGSGTLVKVGFYKSIFLTEEQIFHILECHLRFGNNQNPKKDIFGFGYLLEYWLLVFGFMHSLESYFQLYPKNIK